MAGQGAGHMTSRDQRHDDKGPDGRFARDVGQAPARDSDGLATAARALGGLQGRSSVGISPRDVVALHRSAGNHAVGRLMRQATRDAVTLDIVIPDSVSSDELPVRTTRHEAEEEPATDAPATSQLTRQLQRAVGARLQRKEEDTLELCPRYWRHETPRDVGTYNCAGLAWRTYDFRGNLAQERSAVAACGPPSNTPGEVKHWFWEYDLHLETDSGLRGPETHDFHTVAGVVDKAGADPDDVYSKNGARRVYGPGTGPSWKPPARDRATSNDPSETPASTTDGQPLFKVRSNFKELIRSRPCAGTR